MAERPQPLVTRPLPDAVNARIEEETCPPWLLRPGWVECAGAWETVSRVYTALTGAALPEAAPPRERRRLDIVLTYNDGSRQVLEVDERQHFTAARGTALALYPADAQVGFDRDAWRSRCQALAGREPGGGFAKPRPPLFPGEGGRHRQRAFRDTLADLLPPEHGWLPTIRLSDREAVAVASAADPAAALRDLLADCGVPASSLAGRPGR
ncbi:hypothetical protein ACH492_15670 [Streptomyces sp. NPDC019443]|uniref:hypothetical protein n=1 Tax=Streptomyces sp. NPDC019443 TaxID=3365061 RepID=UPI0037BB8241